MPFVNTPRRKGAAIAWLVVFVVVFALQAVDAFAFDNRLQHLTNWAWLFHGGVAAARALSARAPHVLTLLAFDASLFVAAGIASVQVMDNSMLESYEESVGAAVVFAANFLFHYAPPIFWALVLAWDRGATREWYRKTPLATSLTQTNVVTLMAAGMYSLLFCLREQYPGPRIDFVILFSASAAAVVVGNAFVAAGSLEETQHDPLPESKHPPQSHGWTQSLNMQPSFLILAMK